MRNKENSSGLEEIKDSHELYQKPVHKPKVLVLNNDQKQRLVRHSGSMEDLLQPSLAKPADFDIEMQKRGLKERIKSIESLNVYLSSELGRNNEQTRYKRNEALYKETSTNSTVLRNKEANNYMNILSHVRSSSNLPLNWVMSSPSQNKARAFPFQRRPHDPPIKTISAKKQRDNFIGPVSPRHHFVATPSLKWNENCCISSKHINFADKKMCMNYLSPE